jgi:hypothetical protein
VKVKIEGNDLIYCEDINSKEHLITTAVFKGRIWYVLKNGEQENLRNETECSAV